LNHLVDKVKTGILILINPIFRPIWYRFFIQPEYFSFQQIFCGYPRWSK